MSPTRKIAFTIVTVALSLSSTLPAMADGFDERRSNADVARWPRTTVDVQVNIEPSESDFQPPIVREQVDESYSERHSVREYAPR